MPTRIFFAIFFVVFSLTNNAYAFSHIDQNNAAIAPNRSIELRQDQITTINSISDYLRNSVTMQGDFIQVANNGAQTAGQFFIRRPGLMRFEYAPPTKLLFMADGFWVGVIDFKIKNTADRYPLSETPLAFVLSDNPDILKKTDILDFYFEPGLLSITMADKAGKMNGYLTMVFSGADMGLTSWAITDEQGRQTTINLSNVKINEPISGEKFSLHKY